MNLISSNTRVLVVAPHVDDEINCAGLLVRARKEKARVLVVACSACEESVPVGFDPRNIMKEFRSSCGLLGVEGKVWHYEVRHLADKRQDILEKLVDINRSYIPNVVVCPSSTDGHQDHKVIYEECFRAFRNRILLGWESPNNQRESVTNLFVTLSNDDVLEKINAWYGYKTQHHRTYFDDAFIRSLAEVRGKQCRSHQVQKRLPEG
jgi:LmbE family N-acetylglucosaminyl deacetylase